MTPGGPDGWPSTGWATCRPATSPRCSGSTTATDFTQFKAALTGWHAPTQNFVYADKAGNIGVIAPGYYPQVAAGLPAVAADAGHRRLRHHRGDPGPGGAAGLRPAVAPDRDRQPAAGHSGDYPYYVGTSARLLRPRLPRRATPTPRSGVARAADRPTSVAALQNDVTDPLASRVLPSLLTALGAASLSSPTAIGGRALLSSWNYAMDAGSAAASLWWTFWDDYLTTVFEPWWKAGKVPVGRGRRIELAVGPGQRAARRGPGGVDARRSRRTRPSPGLRGTVPAARRPRSWRRSSRR